MIEKMKTLLCRNIQSQNLYGLFYSIRIRRRHVQLSPRKKKEKDSTGKEILYRRGENDAINFTKNLVFSDKSLSKFSLLWHGGESASATVLHLM